MFPEKMCPEKNSEHERTFLCGKNGLDLWICQMFVALTWAFVTQNGWIECESQG